MLLNYTLNRDGKFYVYFTTVKKPNQCSQYGSDDNNTSPLPRNFSLRKPRAIDGLQTCLLMPAQKDGQG